MSLTQKRKMTQKNLAAHRSNGPQSRGPATPAGKARSAASKLRHGFYSQARDEALLALGEDPDDYARLLKSLADDLQPREGLESELVLRMARALWRMQRSERMQDGLAMKRVASGMQSEELLAGSKLLRNYRAQERLEALGTALTRRDYLPSAAEIQAFAENMGSNPSPEMQRVFVLLQALGKPPQDNPGPASESLDTLLEPAGEGPGPEAARQELQALLDELVDTYRKACSLLMQQCENVRSPENRAALMAPQDENALLMQRMEDSSLRQLWRLTNVLIKVRNGALTQKDVKNAGRSG
ncbi:MAG: hypothetical protein ABSA41_15100 [Terriglobia bacterium]